MIVYALINKSRIRIYKDFYLKQYNFDAVKKKCVNTTKIIEHFYRWHMYCKPNR